ncbi:PIN domain-containing protein [Algoriphagus sp.]|uniref:PIN domain-containing protein n=1 Tax=Algoriphagus sp. TaxID=1872435 RepID=UPI0025EDAFB1|nr:PIN domain-containing protein [Algoriphagus sp.]
MKKVLIDTSVWIEFLKGNKEIFDPMMDLMENGEIYTLELIFAELMQGVRSAREHSIITEFYQQMRVLDQPGLIFQAGEYSRKEKLLSKGIGLIDAVLIYSAQNFGIELWTLDKKIQGYLSDKLI